MQPRDHAGHSTTAVITFAQLPGAAAANPYNLTFTLMVRIPSWAREGPAGVQLELNGLSYNGCPGAPTPSSYCRITRCGTEPNGMTKYGMA